MEDTQIKRQIRKVAPAIWLIDIDMALHEAENMGIIGEGIVKYNTFPHFLYEQISIHLRDNGEAPGTTKSDASIRVLLSSKMRDIFRGWDPNELSIFQSKLLKQMEDIDQFGEPTDKEIEEEIRVTWKDTLEQAYNKANQIVDAKQAKERDPGIWHAICLIAGSLN